MTKKVSVFLGGFGFGNLGDEACLKTSYDIYKGDINCVFTHNKLITSKAATFDFYFSDIEDVFNIYKDIDTVCIAGGGVGFNPSLKDNLDWALRCMNHGAKLYIHNIGIGKVGHEWLEKWPALKYPLLNATEFSVRDYRSRAEVLSWGLDINPEISHYPEKNLSVSKKLKKNIPVGKYLGLSVTNRQKLWEHISANKEVIRILLSQFSEHRILPIVSTIHAYDAEEHDNVGFLKFCDEFNLKDRITFPEVCNYDFWLKNTGPEDVKYMISRCDFLISARKHNIIHAIGTGVPFVGIFEHSNDSIPRVFQTLFPEIPKSSSLYPLYDF